MEFTAIREYNNIEIEPSKKKSVYAPESGEIFRINQKFELQCLEKSSNILELKIMPSKVNNILIKINLIVKNIK